MTAAPDYPAQLDEHEAAIEAERVSAADAARAARQVWAYAAGAVSRLYRAGEVNATVGARCCEDAARSFDAASRLAAEPQRTQLRVLSDAAAACADGYGPPEDDVRALIDAAAETVGALESAMLAAGERADV